MKKPSHIRKNQRGLSLGFTLVELLVALVVMALLALLSWRGLDGMTRVQSQTQGHTDNVLALQAGLSQWQTDLDAITLQANVPGVPGLNYDGNVLRLTRRYAEQSDKANQGGQSDQAGQVSQDEKNDSIRVVAWSQRTDDKGTQWLRWQSAPLKTRAELQAAWLQAAVWAKEGSEADRKREVSVATIEKWQLLYYENDIWVNAISATANSGTVGAAGTITLPDGVRLVLTLAPDQALTGNITRDWVRPSMGGGRG
jgi:general secretion pathway protein J